MWARAFKRTLYANLYVLLTGGPGVGKTDALRGTREFWEEITGLHVAPSSVSRASLIDDLNAAQRKIIRPTDRVNPIVDFNALNAGVTEFGTFMTQYEGEFLSTLNDLYDCIPYKERKRSLNKGEPLKMDKPFFNLIAGTTPSWLGNTLPDHAWSEGFSSRMLFVFSAERVKVNPFDESAADEKLKEDLIVDLRAIHGLWGQMQFEPEFADTFSNWYMANCPPIPEHPKLEHYLTRRHIHFLKLAMVFSVQRSSELVLRIEDYQDAMDMLIYSEGLIPDLFKSLKGSSDSNVIDEAFNFVWTEFNRSGQKGIPEHRIVRFLSEKVPSHTVLKILEIMVQSRIIEISNIAGPGGRPEYKPVPKGLHGS